MPTFNTEFSIIRDEGNILVNITADGNFGWCGQNTVINSLGVGDRFVVGVNLDDDGVDLDFTKSIAPDPTGITRGEYINLVLDLITDARNTPKPVTIPGGSIGITQASDIEVSVTNAGFVDSANSTTTPLGIGATFSGSFTETTEYSEFTCIVRADVPGTLLVDLSSNGVDIDRTKIIPQVGGGVHTLAIVSQFTRVRYVNGSVGQSVLRLQTIFHKFKSKALTSTTSQIIGDQDDIELIRIVNDHTLDLARGVVRDKMSFIFIGRNPNVTSSDQDVWTNGGDYNFLAGATILEIASNNIEDGITGLGARTVVIEGVDAGVNLITETISLVGNGISIGTTNSFLRVTKAFVDDAGTYRGSNFNDLNIQVSGSGPILGVINGGFGTINTASYGIGETQLGLSVVPAGKTLYIREIAINIGGNKEGDVSLYFVENIDDTTAPTKPRRLIYRLSDVLGNNMLKFDTLVKVPGKSDLWFRGNVTSGTAVIDVQLGAFLIDDPVGG